MKRGVELGINDRVDIVNRVRNGKGIVTFPWNQSIRPGKGEKRGMLVKIPSFPISLFCKFTISSLVYG